jgi:beta-1,4-mannosyltransferase
MGRGPPARRTTIEKQYGPGVARAVHIAPVAQRNPYQVLLGARMRELGGRPVRVRRLRLRRAFDPRLGTLHLHWLEMIVKSNDDRPYARLRLLGNAARLVATLAIARARGVRIVWTVHNLVPHEARFKGIDRALARVVARLAHVVTAHSQHAAAKVVEAYGRADVTVARHGHYIGWYPEPQRDRGAVRAELGIPASAHVFLAFGLVRPYKRLPELVAAFQELGRDDVRLLIAGDPIVPSAGEAVRAAAAGDDRVVLRLERIPDEAVRELHAAADTAVLAYDDVFSSGALMLALSCGLPAVAPADSTATEIAPPPVVVPFRGRGSGLAAALAASMEVGEEAASEALRVAERHDWSELASAVLGPEVAAPGRPDSPRWPSTQDRLPAVPDAGELTPEIQAYVAARMMLGDLVAARLAGAFEAARLPMLIIKGPAYQRWLYAPGHLRNLSDIDVVVAPDELHRAERILQDLGFVNNYGGESPDFSQFHADKWIHDELLPVDLHRRIWGVTVDPALAWRLLSADPEHDVVHGQRINFPARRAQLVLLALHAAHHGADSTKPRFDLQHALEQASLEEWQEAAELARELGAVPPFVAGLRLATGGLELAGRVGLSVDADAAWSPLRYDQHLPPTAEGFLRLAEAPDWRAKRALLLREALPSATFMRLRSPQAELARRGQAGLAAAYVVRWFDLLRAAGRGFRFARRARTSR